MEAEHDTNSHKSYLCSCFSIPGHFCSQVRSLKRWPYDPRRVMAYQTSSTDFSLKSFPVVDGHFFYVICIPRLGSNTE